MLFKINQPLEKQDIKLNLFETQWIDKLTELATEQRIWQFTSERMFDPQVFKEKWINSVLKQTQNHTRICFIVFQNDTLAGSSSFYQIDEKNKKLNIGYTWFHPSYWGTIINPIVKLIMLEYAFETLGYHRVEFSVDSVNIPSCKSLSKLGIKQESIIPNHMVLADGRIRDTIIFKIEELEWPPIKNNIQQIINAEQYVETT